MGHIAKDLFRSLNFGCCLNKMLRFQFFCAFFGIAHLQTIMKPGFFSPIAVPGSRVPAMKLLDNFAASCITTGKRSFGMDQLTEITHSLNADEVVEKMYNSLFHAIADVDADKLKGRWYLVVDSEEYHTERCATFEVDVINQTPYTASLSTKSHFFDNAENQILYVGYGMKLGPDAGETLITTDVPVKTHSASLHEPYDYIILSQPLKYPTMVWHRNPEQFERQTSEINQFLEHNGYMSPLAALNTRLRFVNTTLCQY